MSFLSSVGKFLTTPMEWITSPAGWLLDQGLNFLGQYNANQANKELWRMQADYNKPINQLARLREAGLNPNLIYGSGGVQNTITSAPKMEPYSFDLMAYQQLLNGKAQNELLREQKNLVQQQANSTQLKSVGQMLDNVYKNLENKYKAHEVQYFLNKGSVRGANMVDSLFDRLLTFMDKYPNANPMSLLFNVLGTAKGLSDIDYGAVRPKGSDGKPKGFNRSTRNAMEYVLYRD